MNSVPQSGIDFVTQMVQKFSFLRPLYEEHLADLEEILPHLFMADVARWVEAEFKKESDSIEVIHLLNFVEDSFNEHDAYVEELIHVSFLEYIYDLKVDGKSIISLLGESLQKQVAMIGNPQRDLRT